jgi:hypothetical protein
MFRHGIQAAKTKLIGNFLVGRRCGRRPLPFQDKIKNLLLSPGQFNHTVYPYSISSVPGVKAQRRRKSCRFGWRCAPASIKTLLAWARRSFFPTRSRSISGWGRVFSGERPEDLGCI